MLTEFSLINPEEKIDDFWFYFNHLVCSSAPIASSVPINIFQLTKSPKLTGNQHIYEYFTNNFIILFFFLSFLTVRILHPGNGLPFIRAHSSSRRLLFPQLGRCTSPYWHQHPNVLTILTSPSLPQAVFLLTHTFRVAGNRPKYSISPPI